MQKSRTTMLLCAVLAFTGLAAVEAIGTRTTCHQYVCPVEYGFYKHIADWNPRTHECECYPYFTEGPCKDAKCADGYLAVEKAGECACEWPCDGLHCQGPFVAMPDYERKNPDELCICQLPPKSKCHDEL